ncbi:MAG: tetratricopeptide repeat protein [Myxococcales bacterium]|nr:tetratricopeptide repeat protein [Myxococcales bacterium]
MATLMPVAPAARAQAPAAETPRQDAAVAEEGPASDAGVLQDVPTEVVMVLPIESWGEIEEHIPRALVDRMEDGLRRGNFTVIDAAANGGPIPSGECDEACVRSTVAGTNATHLVRASVVVDGRDYNVRVELFLGETGELIATSNDICEICGHEELADMVGDLAATLRRKLSAAVDPPPLLRVVAEPEGSLVTVDGEVVGVTPVEVTVAPGEHDIVVKKAGYVTHRARLAFLDGVVETIRTDLAPAPVIEEEEPPRTKKRALPESTTRPIGWAALGVGVGVTAGGVALLVLDERPIKRECTGDNVDAMGNCKWRYNTLAGGIAMTIVGVGAVALGAVLLARGRYDEALATLQRALDILGEGAGDQSMVRMSTLNIMGSAYDLRGDLAPALEHYRKALAIAERQVGPDHPETAKILNNIAIIHKGRGELEEARRHAERVVTIYRRVFGEAHPDFAASLANLANLQLSAGDYEGALASYDEALRALQAAEAGPGEVGRLLYNLGVAYHLRGRFAEAAESYARSLELQTPVLGPDHPEIAYPLTGLGSSLVELGRFDDALPHLERALAIRSRKDVPPIDIGEIRFALARALPIGERERALELARAAERDYEELGDPATAAAIRAWIAANAVIDG